MSGGILKRLALVPLGVLLALGALEGALQVAAPIVRNAFRSDLPTSLGTGNLRVLCIGDSNTYGLYLPRGEAYPQQLEALWNERMEAPELEVLNLGFPGTNSSRVVRDFQRLLTTFEPDLVIVMVGVNDHWTRPFSLDGAQESGGVASFLRRHSLVYRGYRLWRRGHDDRKLEIDMDREEGRSDVPPGWRPTAPVPGVEGKIAGARYRLSYGSEEFDMGFAAAKQERAAAQLSLEGNLRTLVAQARDVRTRLYLMSYPARWRDYAVPNEVIRHVARSTGAPLIDHAARFEPLCPVRDCPELLFDDGHPKASGYRIVAETIVQRLAAESFAGSAGPAQ